ncbi:hypothetical protein P4S72_27355 [Vibrio sp. PP-XX7]
MPAQNATGNWIKVVQRLPVRIKLDPKELVADPLRIGLSMQVSVATRDQTGKLLSETSPETPRYQTDVYNVSTSDVENMIQNIIKNNDIANHQ